jgi:Aspartyl protease/PDZ domain
MSALHRTQFRIAIIAGIVTLAVGLGVLALDEVRAAPKSGLSFTRDGHARIPFQLRSQHIWVRGWINGTDSIWVVVDTGASSSVIDDGVATRLSLPFRGEAHAMGAGGAQRSRRVGSVTLELPGMTLHRETMGAIDMSAISTQTGRPMEFVLGYELFQSCVVRFDYAAGVMDLWDAKQAPSDLAGVAVPMTLENAHPYVEGELVVPGRKPIKGRFVIDSGSSAALLINPEVTERESLASAFPRTLVGRSRGVGGDLKTRIGRGESFSLGAMTFSKPIVIMPEPGGHISTRGSIGNIGGQVLGRCRVTFDYSRSTIRFEPDSAFAKPFEADMSGATISRTPEGTMVRWVNPETPAAEADLRVGDRVTEIDGESAETVDPPVLRQRFQQDGRSVRLRVQRGDESIEKVVKLRRLI